MITPKPKQLNTDDKQTRSTEQYQEVSHCDKCTYSYPMKQIDQKSQPKQTTIGNHKLDAVTPSHGHS